MPRSRPVPRSHRTTDAPRVTRVTCSCGRGMLPSLWENHVYAASVRNDTAPHTVAAVTYR